MIARPTAVEERWLELGERYPALRAAIDSAGHVGGWKATTRLARGLGFVLGIVVAAMLGGVLSPFGSPLMIGGLVLLVAAEWLVAQRRIFRSGIEEALYLCGAVAVVVQLLIWSDGNNEALGVALLAGTVLVVGWRLLNPLFTTLAAAGFSLAIAMVNGRFFDSGMRTIEASVFCALVALCALVAGGRMQQRSSHDRMIEGLVIVMPWLAFAWLPTYGWRGSAPLVWAALALAVTFLVINLSVGVQRRQHAPLIGALGNLVCAFWALQRLFPGPLHWLLIAGGAAALAVAVLIERALRDRSEGITSRAVGEPDGLDLAQLAAAAHLAPEPGPAPQPAVQGQGGEFGGGGASGRF